MALQILAFSAIRKQRFRIDEDDNRIIELNTSDLGVITRLEELYPKLQELDEEVANITADTDDEDVDGMVKSMGPKLKNIDRHMRDIIDEIFDGEVADKCAPFGNMFDPIEGMTRYEHVITTLVSLYEKKLSSEATKIKNKMNAHTSKYTK